MSTRSLFAVGGAHLDRRGRITGAYIPGASNPGILREEAGGGAFNAAQAAVQRGIAVSLLSLRGGDRSGEAVAAAIAAAKICDLSVTFLDRATPSYTALLDREGELIAGLADMSLYDLGFAKQLGRRAARDAIAAVDAVLCDANLPGPALEKLLRLALPRPVYAVAISPAKVVRLKPMLGELACLFMNSREAAALAGTATTVSHEVVPPLRAAGLKCGIVTCGAQPLIGFDAGQIYRLAPPLVRAVADVTGAGDALAGAMIAALMRGLPFAKALREAAAAALIAVESDKAAPRLSKTAMRAALARMPDVERLP